MIEPDAAHAPSTSTSRSTSPRARAAAARSSTGSAAPAVQPNAHVAVDVDAERLHRPAVRADRLAAVTEYPFQRRLGAFPLRNGRTEFRVWAPNPDEIRLRVGGAEHALEPAGYGIYEATVDAGRGRRLRVRARRRRAARPVLALAAGGPARPVAGRRPRARSSGPTAAFRTPGLHDAVIYELHVGTFSPEGTFEGAIPYLRELAELGVTAIELMPVAEFPGARGWGYDGVYLSAAQSSYGGPLGAPEARRRRPRRGPRRDARRRLQPRRRLRQRGADGLRPVLHAQARDAVGRRA